MGGHVTGGRGRGGRARDRGGLADATMASVRDGRARGSALRAAVASRAGGQRPNSHGSAVFGMPRF